MPFAKMFFTMMNRKDYVFSAVLCINICLTLRFSYFYSLFCNKDILANIIAR